MILNQHEILPESSIKKGGYESAIAPKEKLLCWELLKKNLTLVSEIEVSYLVPLIFKVMTFS